MIRKLNVEDYQNCIDPPISEFMETLEKLLKIEKKLNNKFFIDPFRFSRVVGVPEGTLIHVTYKEEDSYFPYRPVGKVGRRVFLFTGTYEAFFRMKESHASTIQGLDLALARKRMHLVALKYIENTKKKYGVEP